MRLSDLNRAASWVALTASLPTVTFALWPEPSAPSAPPARQEMAPSAMSSRELEQQVERFALNALLVPLLDDAEHPPRWADPTLATACGAG